LGRALAALAGPSNGLGKQPFRVSRQAFSQRREGSLTGPARGPWGSVTHPRGLLGRLQGLPEPSQGFLGPGLPQAEGLTQQLVMGLAPRCFTIPEAPFHSEDDDEVKLGIILPAKGLR
jgi:hypothetical protein